MKVMLMSHSKLSDEFLETLGEHNPDAYFFASTRNGQVIALTAIRTCYSHLKPSEIFATEYERYFENEATDGHGGSDADRLFRQIHSSGHTSTLEHISFTFLIEGVSRALLAQLTRHRVGFSFSVQSQRYVKFGSDNKSGGFGYVVPPKIQNNPDALYRYEGAMEEAQRMYDTLRELGVPAEDARSVLPNGASTNLTMTANLTALLHFYGKRKPGRGGQFEITQLAETIREKVETVEPWTSQFFERM